MKYVFDLDNTLCNTQKREDGTWDYTNSKPFPDRIKIVNKLFEEDNYIIIETARGCTSKKNWYEETYKQLMSFGLKFHELRTGVKFGADLFIDDKGINSEDFFSKPNVKVVDVYPQQTKMTLFNEIFVEKNKERLEEYVFCINKNIDNRIIKKIYFVCNEDLYEKNKDYFYNLLNEKIKPNDKISLILDKDNKRFTFNNFIDFTKELVEDGTIVAASNLDVFIPETDNWINLEKDFFSVTSNEGCLALSRTEYINDSYNFRDERAWKAGEFADCWIFKTPLKLKKSDFSFDIPVGSAPTCDNHMFLIMSNTHKKVFNWAQKYVIYHVDLVRKPDVLEKKAGRMIMNNDVVTLPQNNLAKENKDKWAITPYQDWDSALQLFIDNK